MLACAGGPVGPPVSVWEQYLYLNTSDRTFSSTLCTDQQVSEIAEGQVYEIPDQPDRYFYCIVCRGGDVGFLDLMTEESLSDSSIAVDADLFLRLAISLPTIKRAKWRLLGSIPLQGAMAGYGEYVLGSEMTDGTLQVYNNEDASLRYIPRQQAAHMEKLAVWDAYSHILPLMREHFLGQPTFLSKDIRSSRFHRRQGG